MIIHQECKEETLALALVLALAAVSYKAVTEGIISKLSGLSPNSN